ncbi:uncharacterized protein LY89DRAFT_263659 [Mollisia scopiformis]|uniref:Uncharacterized protein n=1 Tax=Mollisia scopiformis TaxID=149040 RepID=A0A132BEU9_MOLSC|nr:uncharacterized protein LY89DRAFT_263659 [Mollisia scopiformis]KUJ10539.1 hypothetical protein LY89DRAFT_263659 [Mollisia scopiformis]
MSSHSLERGEEEQEEEVTRDYRDLNYEEAWAEYERPNRRRGSIRSRSVTFLGGRARSVSPDTLWMAEDFWSRKPEASYDSPSSSKNSELFTRYGPRGVSGLRWREYGVRKRSSFPRSTRGESGESRPSSPESRISNNEEEDVSKLNVDEAKISINDVDPEKKLCEACQGINAERLAVGYKHLRLADLDASVRSCKFCEFLRHHFGTPRFPWSNRFQVVLSKLWADIIDVQSGESVKGR